MAVRDRSPEMEDLQGGAGSIFNPRVTSGTEHGLARRILGDRRLLLVSNREPYVRKRTPEGVRFERTTGGLVTALEPVMRESGGVWVAWQPESDAREAALETERRFRVPDDGPQFTLRQVPLSMNEVARYYHGFANGALWPLCHYFVDRCRFDEEEWRQYEQINDRFATAVVEEARAGDVVWVHDYHFCLLPRKIRERRRQGGPIAFFLHIPFPAEEVFRVLPWRRQVLEGLLGADLVGFHTEEYAGDFLGCCERLLDAEVDHERQVVHWDGREVRVGAFPIGIDVDEFRSAAASAEAEERAASIRRGLGGAALILGVDRLDYSKGILERLHAIDVLLETRPELRRRLVFLQVAVPSREQVHDYRELKKRVDEMVGFVNGKHGTANWQPVRYLYRGVPREELVAYYRAADVCLVNPLRDGMNLVAMEFVACQQDGEEGALVLSELTGAARTLGDGALLINPFAIQETADTLAAALSMEPAERQRRMHRLFERVAACDVHGWLERILTAALEEPRPRGQSERVEEARTADGRGGDGRAKRVRSDPTRRPWRPKRHADLLH
ncbi:MAG TPA: trehalose-6-phosphate synthase [Thermoanaerobaculia bacterium]|jgi:trehalose 6-phosphate synthase|nr:trehalose-6-phosphate synthase [Thermoanaerobaculia bacterium]